VKTWFSNNHADALINLFAVDDKLTATRVKSTLYDITLESFSNYMNVNLTCLFSVCREFARNNEKGTILNFSSNYGITSPDPSLYSGSHKHIGYCVSKAGVIMLTKYLATHLAPAFRVNCIAPAALKHKQSKEFIEAYSKHIPMGRMMEPGELNRLVEYLCTDDSSYVNGATFNIDGGYLCL
jgi:NAD(P)-dependent dehydrogenase (short-subunit alcohol dehydrogenase family)